MNRALIAFVLLCIAGMLLGASGVFAQQPTKEATDGYAQAKAVIRDLRGGADEAIEERYAQALANANHFAARVKEKDAELAALRTENERLLKLCGAPCEPKKDAKKE